MSIEQQIETLRQRGLAIDNEVMARQMTAYQRSLDDERYGRINHYANSEDFFEKMGI